MLQDLAQYVNEVKRDTETMREIEQYQHSIENLVSDSYVVSSERKPVRVEVRSVGAVCRLKQPSKYVQCDNK